MTRETLDVQGTPTGDATTFYEYDGTQQTKKTTYAGIQTTPGGTKTNETTYAYNLQGRLAQVAIDADGDGMPTTTSSYRYNDDGVRVWATEQVGAAAAVTTIYHVASNNPTGFAQVLEEGTDANADGRLQVGEVGKTYTLGHDVISQFDATNGLLYLMYDGHGSTRALVDLAPTLALVQRYAYDAYGKMLLDPGLTSDVGAALTSLLYSGEKTDPTGLQYLRSRYYDPSVGRFTSFDSFAGNMQDPQSLHKYLYVHANPVMGIDPSGMFEGSLAGLGTAISVGAQIGALSGSVIGAWDAALQSDATVGSVLWGAGVGFIGGGIGGGLFGGLGVLASLGGAFGSLGYLSAMTALAGYSTYQGASESFSQGETAQGIFRATVGAIGTIVSAAGTMVSAQTIVSSGNGRLGGVVVSGATKAIFQGAMRAIGVMINEVPASTVIGGKPTIAAQYSSQTRTITVKSGATFYEYTHEMFHALNHVWSGTAAYRETPKLAREENVYNLMRLFLWGYLSEAEKANAVFNVEARRGFN